MQIDFQKYEVDEQERSITFSCASDLPYSRYDEQKHYAYDEVLVISDDAIDLTRLNGGASVLFNHDSDVLLGCVDKAYVVENKLYVKVRFSRNSDEAVRIYYDILDGVVKNVSIGYQVQHYSEKKDSGVITRFVDRWMPYEISVVSIPADETVGIRSLKKQEDINMEEENNPIDSAVAEAQAEVAEDKVELADDTAKLEALRQEIDDLRAKMEELTKPCDEEKACGKKECGCDPDGVDEPVKDEEEIKACGEALGVPEKEIERAIAKGMSAKDFKRDFRNYNININIKENKSMSKFAEYLRAGNFNEAYTVRAGEYPGWTESSLVGTEIQPLVKILEKRMGVKGFKTLSGLKQNISIPVQTGRPTITQTETLHTDASLTEPDFTARTLSPKKFTGMTRISKDLLVQCNDDIQAFVIDALTAEIGYKLENYLLGVVNTNAGETVTYSALSAFDWDDALAFEAKVGGYNLNDLNFVMSPAARAALKGITKDTGSGRFICEDNEVNGYAVSVTGCASNDNIYFGDWGHLVVGNWGEGLEILVDPYTYGASGDVRIVGTVCADAVIDNTGAFVVGKVEESSSSSSSSSSI